MDETQAGIKFAGRNINNLTYADDTTFTAESEEGLKNPSMKVKEKTEKAGLTLNIQKTNILASGPITLWHMDGETTETMTDCIFLGSRVTVDGDCSHGMKRCLFLERNVWHIKNILKKSILKSRDITLSTNFKAIVFPVVMYGCESWTIKKAEH